MSNVALLSHKQHRLLIDRYYSGSSKFNPVLHQSGFIVLTEHEINANENEECNWVADLPLISLESLVRYETTPPDPLPYGVVIPNDYNKLGFWQTKLFKLNGFEVPLTDYNGGLAVNLAYLLWEGFREEQDNPINEVVKDEFSTLWYELKTKAENNDLVQL